jgi:hypothetical protein
MMVVQIDASTARLSVFLAEIEVQIDGPSISVLLADTYVHPAMRLWANLASR